ncbi:MAG: right-handed parallel beta-helix repeat-containing protein [Verrucomicrobiota bacterium]
MQRSVILISGMLAATAVCIQMAGATTNYVDRYGTNPVANYTTWATAATNIQDAVDVAMATPGNTVLVSNGVYATGGKKTPSYALTNRVCATNAIILRSVNGPNYTSIKGAPAPEGGLGTGAVRCVYLSGGASLIGFTLTNGYTMTSGTYGFEQGGAGVWVYQSGTVSNCLITGNYGWNYGGGAGLYDGGTINNCVISNNSCSAYGAGVFLWGLGGKATMKNCIVITNSAVNFGSGVCMIYNTEANNCLITKNIGHGSYAGGVFAWYQPTLLNGCTIVGNYAGTNVSAYGGGGMWYQAASSSSVTNCIIWGNLGLSTTSNIYLGGATTTFSYVCSGPVQAGTANTGADPLFAGQAAGNYRLTKDSPCVNAGIYQGWMTDADDVDGHRRVDKFSGIVDLGCYEYIPQGTLFSVP